MSTFFKVQKLAVNLKKRAFWQINNKQQKNYAFLPGYKNNYLLYIRMIKKYLSQNGHCPHCPALIPCILFHRRNIYTPIRR